MIKKAVGFIAGLVVVGLFMVALVSLLGPAARLWPRALAFRMALGWSTLTGWLIWRTLLGMTSFFLFWMMLYWLWAPVSLPAGKESEEDNAPAIEDKAALA